MQIFNGRYGASIDGDFVPFLLGARINRLRYIVSFLPIGRAMGRPLRCRSGLGPRPPARPDDLSCADFRHGPLQKSRSGDRSHSHWVSRLCGLLWERSPTAIVGIIEDRDQEIAPIKVTFVIGRSLPQDALTRRLITESANFIGCDLTD